ncbi:MAG: hypothetical protein ACLTG0_12255 [Oscillibacter sp.]
MSWIVKLGKKGKKIVKKIITPAEKHYVGYTRRIEAREGGRAHLRDDVRRRPDGPSRIARPI